MTLHVYSGGAPSYHDDSYTPPLTQFVAPFVVVRNVGTGACTVQDFSDVGGPYGPVQLLAGETVCLPIADGETFRPYFIANTNNGAEPYVYGWIDE